MARKKRIRDAGLLRHVMARGNNRMRIFLNAGDYRKFLFVLSDVCEAYQVDCWAFCLMPNHYHLVVRNEQRNLSEALRDLNGEYALWWNATHRRLGHVFQGRYKDQIVEPKRYLLTLLRYVGMNPIRAKLVDDPAKWPWSSYRCTAGLCPNPGFVSVEEVLRQFGGDELAVLRQRYVRYVLAQPDREEPDMEQFRSRELVLGSRAFKLSILGAHEVVAESAIARPATAAAING